MKVETPEEKYMLQKINKDLEKMNKTNLNHLKNHELRIYQREKEIEHLDALYRPTPIMSNELIKSSFNKQFYKTKNTFFKNSKKKYNLPRLNTNPNFKTLNTYKRMKNYKLSLKKKKSLKSEEKIKKFLGESGFKFIPSNLFFNGENITMNNFQRYNKNNNERKSIYLNMNSNLMDKNNKTEKKNNKNQFKKRNSTNYIFNNNYMQDKMNINSNKGKNQIDDRKEINNKNRENKKIFEYYLQMQSKAEILLKPKIGDNSNDLINYIKAIQGIRENLIGEILTEINKAENRYNKENPEEDINFVVKDKGLNIHKWKNLFYLKDYQKFFLDGLKGKISTNNYNQMQRKFRQIQHVCFSEGKKHFNHVKNLDFPE